VDEPTTARALVLLKKNLAFCNFQNIICKCTKYIAIQYFVFSKSIESMNKYRERLKEIYPDFSDEQIEELIEFRVKFWR
jgi:hypothetical protein